MTTAEPELRWWSYCEYLAHFRPATEFYVDGIRYDPNWPTMHIRPMLSFEPDGGGDAVMAFSRPPLTDEALDGWVQTGYLRLPDNTAVDDTDC